MDALLRALQGENEASQFAHASKVAHAQVGSGVMYDYWRIAGQPGAAPAPPAAGEQCDRTSPGALVLPANPAGVRRFLSRFAAWGTSTGVFILYDRLWHASGSFANINVAQVLNSPLVQRGPYEGVQVALEASVPPAASTQNVTIAYEDETGVSRSVAINMGSGITPLGRMTLTPTFQQTNKGARRVVSYTSTTANIAGSFDIVMFRPLVMILGGAAGADRDLFDLGAVEIPADACLGLAYYSYSTIASAFSGGIQMVSVPA